ncbi:PAS domain S-box protein [Aneurinibacillus sp. Ricciae_BoGa-3]|uniref:PAS domain S-box protein n=1 Tax=Aneurinibacillus sp. Ricciae_BoGa-3 TaxID=3022697 RepID=UPI0023422DDD|nr:PAS domain S-box protein [Aneurinibacillus sp. Ricciae_BoGa-3]WCK54232.1 PAS domain S-box protein [Aneurinibacillus sp. Ricciae_BoGa-3]
MLPTDKSSNSGTFNYSSFVAREELNHLFNLSVDLFCIISVDGYFKTLNPSWEHTLGFTRERLCSEPFVNFIHPDDQRATLHALDRLSQGENVLNFENRYRCKDGTYKWLMWNTIVENERFYSVARDITKQKEMEKELRESEERYRRLVELSPDTVVVHTDEKITYLNETGLKLVGAASLGEIAGRSIMDFIDPSSRESAFERKRRIQTEGKLTDSGEYKIRKLDGSQIEMELQSTTITYDGKSAVLAVMRDISSRKKMEKELWETQERYRIITENVSDIISIYDKEGTLKYTSPSRASILGGFPEACTEKQLFSGMHPDDRKRVEAAYERMVAMKEPIRQEFRYRHINGHWITLETIAIPAMEENGSIEDVVLVSRDTTERKRMEEIIRRTDKLAVVGELAAGIAHEIRNPLTSLVGFTQLLQSRDKENEQYFEIMLSELNRINLIVGEFLLLAKPHILSFEMKNLAALLGNVVSILESEANKNNIQIITDIPANIPNIKCEQNQMKQVLINILKNAIEAMPNGGRIFVKVKMEDDQNILIQVTDQGCGISEDRLSKLGEPFYTTKEKGTGLGLTVSYKIVQNHHGKMRIKSEKGKGTTVEIVLPV